MYEPVKFKRLRDLSAELNAKLEALGQGKLSSEELEAMTESSRELYERLVVLRFKAYDDKVKEEAPATAVENQVEAEVETPVNESPAPIIFKIDSVPNQVSLIDAIEEVTKQEATPQQKAADSSPQQPVMTETVHVETHTVTNEFRTRDNVMKSTHVHQESLHERLTKGMDVKESLAHKLEHNPISDLKRAISLNQRFQFSKELFKGNNQDYEMAIDKLNTAEREEALKHLNTLRSRYAWNDDSAVTNDFVNLVERRHQH